MLERIKEVLEKRGIKKLYPYQIEAFKKILSGKSTLIIAPTGYGKTEACILPILYSILERKLNAISAIYITPLRALNRDLLERLGFYFSELGLRIVVRHGDTSESERKRHVENPPHMLITTPELLNATITGKKIRELLRNVKYVVIDEVHELAFSKRGVQLSLLLERLSRIARFVRVGLSATVSNEEEVMKFFKFDERVKVGERRRMDVDVILAPENYLEEIKKIIERYKKVLVFTNTRDSAEWLSYSLSITYPELRQRVHHSCLSRDERIEVEREFKSSKINAIVCTSSLELGIDIGDVNCVVQFSSPREVVRLVQRIGRSKHRKVEVPKGFIVTVNEEDYKEALSIVEMMEKGYLEKRSVYRNCLDILAHSIVGMSIEGYRSAEEIYSIVKSCYPYSSLTFEKFIEVVDFLIHAGFLRSSLSPTRRGIEYYFSSLSSIPEIRYFAVVSNGRVVGFLDEVWVSSCDENRIFVMGSRVWRIERIDYERLRVYVSEEEGVASAPFWVGGNIPVSYEVARNVLKSNKVVFKRCVNGVILETYFGDKVNLTLEIFLRAVLSSKYGASLETFSDSYRIYLKNAGIKDVEEVLLYYSSEDIRKIIEIYAHKTDEFRKRFFFVAKRFGVISRKASMKEVKVNKLIRALKDTVVYEEALNELFTEKLDIEKAMHVYEKLRNGGFEIEVVECKELIEKFLPRKDAALDIDVVRRLFLKRLMKRKIYLICANCRNVVFKGSVETACSLVEKGVKCSRCGSSLIACCKSVKCEKIVDNAYLVKNHGRYAVLALSSTGVYVDTAKRILSFQFKDFRDFIDRLIEEERRYRRWKGKKR